MRSSKHQHSSLNGLATRPAVFTIAASLFLLLLAILDVTNEEPALNLLIPSFLLPLSSLLVAHGYLLTLLALTVNVALLGALLLLSILKRGSFTSFSHLLLVLLGVLLGQGFLLTGYTRAGVVLYVESVGSFLIFVSKRFIVGAFGGEEERVSPLVFPLLFIFALVSRLIALNVLPSVFEGELSPYMLGSVHPSRWAIANAGVSGPWAPLGLLYYPPNYIGILIFGPTPEAIRFGSVIVFLITLPLFYVVARRLLPTWEGALFATAVFILDPLFFGWSRTDIHPHHVTTWITLLLIYLSIEALELPSFKVFLGLSFAMALSWHQYPSGQAAVLIPLLPITWKLLTDGNYRHSSGALPLFLILGLIGWGLGHTLEHYLGTGEIRFTNIFSLTTARTSWGSFDNAGNPFLHVVTQALTHAKDLLEGIYWRMPYVFHQEILPPVPHLEVRSVFWFIASFSTVGLVILCRVRGIRSILIVWSLLLSLAPAILSSQAFVKRAAPAFALLILLSGYGASLLKRGIESNLGARSWQTVRTVWAFLALGYCLAMPSLWRMNTMARPYELELRDEVRHRLTPGTAVIAITPTGYMRGKLAYLLSKDLESVASTLWYGCDHLSCIETAYLPLEDILPLLPRTFEYHWSRLRLPEETQMLTRILYLVEEGLPLDRDKFGGGECTVVERRIIERKEGEEPSIVLHLCDRNRERNEQTPDSVPQG